MPSSSQPRHALLRTYDYSPLKSKHFVLHSTSIKHYAATSKSIVYLQCNHCYFACCMSSSHTSAGLFRVLLTIGVRLLCQRKCPSVPIGSRSHEDLDLECHGPPKTERNLSGIKCDSNALLGRTSIRQVSIKTPRRNCGPSPLSLPFGILHDILAALLL